MYQEILFSCSYSCGDVTSHCRQWPAPSPPSPASPSPPPPRPRPPALSLTLAEKLQMLGLVSKKLDSIIGDGVSKRSLQPCSEFIQLMTEFLYAYETSQPDLNNLFLQIILHDVQSCTSIEDLKLEAFQFQVNTIKTELEEKLNITGTSTESSSITLSATSITTTTGGDTTVMSTTSTTTTITTT